MDTLDETLGAKFLVEPDMARAAEIMDLRISEKRAALGFPDHHNETRVAS